MLKVQEYLRTPGNSPESLKEWLKINFKPLPDGRVLFKYNQIDTPMAEPIAQECRGLILNSKDNWNVVACPFFKFFNYGEGHAANLDWSSVSWFEKLDGSMISLYYFNNQWHVSTSGTPDAKTQVHNEEGLTFEKLFWDTFNSLGWRKPEETNYTFVFELTSPYNRIVVPYTKSDLHLLMVRNNETLKEVDVEWAAKTWEFKTPVRHSIKNLDDALAILETKNGLETEGFVVVDKNFNRIKIKNTKYVALAHIKDNFSDRRVVELVRLGEDEEFLSYFPEYTHVFEKFKAKFNKIYQATEEVYNEIKDIPVQKDFALKATKHEFSSALFCVRNGKAGDFKEYYNSIPVDRLMQLLEKY